MTHHLRLTFRLPAHPPVGLEDELTADLWAVGTAGIELAEEVDEGATRVRAEAWFGEGVLEEAALEHLVRRWRRRGVEVAAPETVPEADWLALWREGARPIPVGGRLLLDPREPGRAKRAPKASADAAGRHLLRLPARRAFGTGSHETTRLALGLLESACFPADRSEGDPCPVASLLDVGTGTGVLAFAARRFGVPRVMAYDVDPQAVTLARDNASLNGFTPTTSPRWWIGTAAALAPGVRFELVTLNVLPHLVDADLPCLARAVAPGGALLLAGPLAEEGGAVVERLASLGMGIVEQRREGAWAGFRFEPAGRRTEGVP